MLITILEFVLTLVFQLIKTAFLIVGNIIVGCVFLAGMAIGLGLLFLPLLYQDGAHCQAMIAPSYLVLAIYIWFCQWIHGKFIDRFDGGQDIF